MKPPLWLDAAGALLTLGGSAVVSSSFYIAQTIKTGDPRIDRWGIRYRIAWYCLCVFGPRALADGCSIPRAMMAIANNECPSDSSAPIIGDEAATGGPSVGPLQVYRRTAKELGLWTPPDGADDAAERQAYADKANDEAWCVHAGVCVFKAKLAEHGDDISTAIRAYNGSGPGAEAYRSKALAFVSDLGWTLGGAA